MNQNPLPSKKSKPKNCVSEEANKKTPEPITLGRKPKPSSTTGTTNTALNGLQIEDLCRIINTCKSANVSCFELGSLKITFAQVVSESAESTRELQVATQVNVACATFTRELQVATQVNVAQAGSKEIELPKSLVTAADSQVIEDMQRSQLMMDDPVAFEALMVDDHMQRQGIAQGGTT